MVELKLESDETVEKIDIHLNCTFDISYVFFAINFSIFFNIQADENWNSEFEKFRSSLVITPSSPGSIPIRGKFGNIVFDTHVSLRYSRMQENSRFSMLKIELKIFSSMLKNNS